MYSNASTQINHPCHYKTHNWKARITKKKNQQSKESPMYDKICQLLLLKLFKTDKQHGIAILSVIHYGKFGQSL